MCKMQSGRGEESEGAVGVEIQIKMMGEELPHVQGQGWRLGGATPCPHAWGWGRRPGDQPHVQGDVAARAQEGLEELSHVEGQEGRRLGDTPHPR